MVIKLQVLERVTISGKFSEGDSDADAQQTLVDMGCNIISFSTPDSNTFVVVGERPHSELSAEDYLETAMGEDAYAEMMGLDD
jgi:hypothetical protein